MSKGLGLQLSHDHLGCSKADLAQMRVGSRLSRDHLDCANISWMETHEFWCGAFQEFRTALRPTNSRAQDIPNIDSLLPPTTGNGTLARFLGNAWVFNSSRAAFDLPVLARVSLTSAYLPSKFECLRMKVSMFSCEGKVQGKPNILPGWRGDASSEQNQSL